MSTIKHPNESKTDIASFIANLPAEFRNAIPGGQFANASEHALSKTTSALEPAVFNHSFRVFLYAQRLALQDSRFKSISTPEFIFLLFITCIFHDMGSSHLHNGDQRFEVEGADVAEEYLLKNGVSKSDSREAWLAIATHTCTGIAERISELSKLLRMAVVIDFQTVATLSEPLDPGFKDFIVWVENVVPRLEIEKALGDAVVSQAMDKPSKAPASTWPGNMLRWAQQNPDSNGVNGEF